MSTGLFVGNAGPPGNTYYAIQTPLVKYIQLLHQLSTKSLLHRSRMTKYEDSRVKALYKEWLRNAKCCVRSGEALSQCVFWRHAHWTPRLGDMWRTRRFQHCLQPPAQWCPGWRNHRWSNRQQKFEEVPSWSNNVFRNWAACTCMSRQSYILDMLYMGWKWRNFVPYLCQLIFAAILSVNSLINVCQVW